MNWVVPVTRQSRGRLDVKFLKISSSCSPTYTVALLCDLDPVGGEERLRKATANKSGNCNFTPALQSRALFTVVSLYSFVVIFCSVLNRINANAGGDAGKAHE